MVLGKFNPKGPGQEHVDLPPVGTDGSVATFDAFLAENVRNWGDKVVYQHKIRREWRRWTHVDVQRESRALAAGLIEQGLQPGDRVVMVMDNGWDWVRSYYGIVLARGIAVPIYYDLKAGEIGRMATHADPKFAIVGPKHLPKLADMATLLQRLIIAGDDAAAAVAALPAGAPQAMTLDEVAASATDESRKALNATVVVPEDVASIVFTSGTSGGAKGVMLTHRNIMANTRAGKRALPLNEDDRIIVVLPMHHAFPFILAICVGPAVGMELTFENDLRRIRDRMAEVKPTIFQGVPALLEIMYRNVLKSIEAQGKMETFQKGLRIAEATKQRTGVNIGRIVFREIHHRLGGHLRFMVSAGAALNPQVGRDFATIGIPVIQGWGLSEAAPVITAQRWHPRRFYMSNYYEERMGSIGWPMDGVDVALIDVPEKELYVHLHGEGEIIARGENITPGYWRAPEETEKIKLGEWLRTGDIGRIDEEGNLWITGRSKFVIVLDSGEKIHPDEVEEKIELSPLVQDVMVMARKMRGKMMPVALVYPNYDELTARLGAGVSIDDIQRAVESEVDAMQADIAQYKRVAEVILTDEPLPRTAIRKIMRGQVRDEYTFETARWAASWKVLQDETNAAANDVEAQQAEEESLAGVS